MGQTKADQSPVRKTQRGKALRYPVYTRTDKDDTGLGMI